MKSEPGRRGAFREAATDDLNQIEVPPSFVALYTAPSGHRLTEPMATVRQRYELCEDLAQMLTEQGATIKFKSDAPESEVLESIQAGLSGTDSPVQPGEAAWVVRRLAELLDWPSPRDPSSR
ncbi:hypothetical protein PE066_06255 [Ramlibacter tataouinensis]|uniref:hypothetical protein n=1 Tax=Ramlibacter tataouinensis TaxID=94132 RepID=UPI0022F37D5C|nr:hypothetical protein [Ramlibacter tataouinensis]WBY03133.1 hypothetical protein PE066_06255 [Ramlibacter tataouinensis]